MRSETIQGAFIGRGTESGTYVAAEEGEDYIFGFVLLNDWSARDVQGFEMMPLGPFNGKSFGTSISPWVVTVEALKGEVPFVKSLNVRVR